MYRYCVKMMVVVNSIHAIEEVEAANIQANKELAGKLKDKLDLIDSFLQKASQVVEYEAAPSNPDELESSIQEHDALLNEFNQLQVRQKLFLQYMIYLHTRILNQKCKKRQIYLFYMVLIFSPCTDWNRRGEHRALALCYYNCGHDKDLIVELF